MGNIVQSFTIQDLRQAIRNADASTADDKPIQRFAMGHETISALNRSGWGGTDPDLARELGTDRAVSLAYEVPPGYLRCYSEEHDGTWFEVKINHTEREPIVTGGSTPGAVSSPVQTIKAHLQVAESNLAQARRLIDTLPLPD